MIVTGLAQENNKKTPVTEGGKCTNGNREIIDRPADRGSIGKHMPLCQHETMCYEFAYMLRKHSANQTSLCIQSHVHSSRVTMLHRKAISRIRTNVSGKCTRGGASRPHGTMDCCHCRWLTWAGSSASDCTKPADTSRAPQSPLARLRGFREVEGRTLKASLTATDRHRNRRRWKNSA